LSNSSPNGNGHSPKREQIEAAEEQSVTVSVRSLLGGLLPYRRHYTVLRSKAPSTVNRWGDNYTSLDLPRGRRPRGIRTRAAEALSASVEAIRQTGVEIHNGRW